MKKVLLILAIMMVGFTQAQRGNRAKMANLSAQEIATMQSKKMTLALDLTVDQEKEVYNLLESQITSRKQNKLSKEQRQALSKAEKRALRLKRMDDKIAMNRSLASILNTDQYDQYKKIAHKRRKKQKEKRPNRL